MISAVALIAAGSAGLDVAVIVMIVMAMWQLRADIRHSFRSGVWWRLWAPCNSDRVSTGVQLLLDEPVMPRWFLRIYHGPDPRGRHNLHRDALVMRIARRTLAIGLLTALGTAILITPTVVFSVVWGYPW